MKIFNLLFVLLIFISCNKVNIKNIDKSSIASFSDIVKIKEWYHTKTTTTQLYRKNVKSIPTPTPLWDLTEYYEEEKIYVTPVQYPNSNVNPSQCLVSYQNDKGEIVNCQFTFVLLNDIEKNINYNDIPNFYPGIFKFQNLPQNFKGSIIKYNIQGDYLSSQRYKNGLVENTN